MEASKTVDFTPSLGKVAAMWSGAPVTARLDDLDKICAVLNCTVGDLPQAELPAEHAD
ncbi:helix-turn-helix domain-containing protein [Rhodococcus jostii]